MPFDQGPGERRRIAVVGGGISGMGAALRLAARHDVTLIEGEERLGGHARTRELDGVPVDTGFIVFNHATYPRLTRLFGELGVPTAPSDMSFGVSLRGGATEYAVLNADAYFAQRRQLANPAHWRMLRDIFRFNARAEAAVAGRPGMTVGELTRHLGLSRRFTDLYLAPFTGAIWSTPTSGVEDFEAAALVSFFRNHGLMGMTGQHQWYTVTGGSREYVARLSDRLGALGVRRRTGAPVREVRRTPFGATVDGEAFDEVVLALHSDDALAVLADADAAERGALGDIRYQDNEMVLHDDPAVMPRRRRVWSSWNYAEPAGGPGERIALTYWMNSLQPLPEGRDVFVTLNEAEPAEGGRIDPSRVHDTATFRHPVLDARAVAAQPRVQALQGRRNTWYCGAWLRNGFHEDGLATAEEVAETILARGAPAIAAE